MFQAMIEKASFHGTLQTVWDRCIKQQINVVACVPGSLKQRVIYGSGCQVGSIRIKTTAPNVSILILQMVKSNVAVVIRNIINMVCQNLRLSSIWLVLY
tara:strand:- start:22590 stop:22886 length:297 start_codon:yes stop_codon:yes gene_type:complete